MFVNFASHIFNFSLSGSRDINLTALLDQKNYLEEHNRHLTSQLTGLQARLRALEDGNSKMKEEVNELVLLSTKTH